MNKKLSKTERDPLRELVREGFRKITHQLSRIERKLDNMAKSQGDLDAAIDNETATIKDVATRVAADIKSLQDQIAAGAPPADLQAQFDKIGNNMSLLSQIDAPVSSTPAARRAHKSGRSK